jgi:hypothetical protein
VVNYSISCELLINYCMLYDPVVSYSTMCGLVISYCMLCDCAVTVLLTVSFYYGQ